MNTRDLASTNCIYNFFPVEGSHLEYNRAKIKMGILIWDITMIFVSYARGSLLKD